MFKIIKKKYLRTKPEDSNILNVLAVDTWNVKIEGCNSSWKDIHSFMFG